MKKKLFVIFLVVSALVFGSAQAQTPTLSEEVEKDTAPVMERTPQGSNPREVVISRRLISPVAETSFVVVSQSSTGSTVKGISSHLDSYRRHQEVVSLDELRVEESRSKTYLEVTRLNQDGQREVSRLALEREKLALQRERELNRLALERQREKQRQAESWSRIIRDGLRDSSQQENERERAKLAERRQRQREFESLAHSLEKLKSSKTTSSSKHPVYHRNRR